MVWGCLRIVCVGIVGSASDTASFLTFPVKGCMSSVLAVDTEGACTMQMNGKLLRGSHDAHCPLYILSRDEPVLRIMQVLNEQCLSNRLWA